MRVKFEIFSYFLGTLTVFIVLGAGWFVQNLPHRVPRAVQDGINFAKSGDNIQARKQLESNLADLNYVAVSILIDDYAFGLGGEANKPRALALIRQLECQYFEIGEKEYYLAKLALRIRPEHAIEWLERSAEAGYGPARTTLGDRGTLRKLGFPETGIDIDYWARSSRNPIPIELVKRLRDC